MFPFIKNRSFQTKLIYHNYDVFSINLSVANLMHDTAYLAITYCKIRFRDCKLAMCCV